MAGSRPTGRSANTPRKSGEPDEKTAQFGEDKTFNPIPTAEIEAIKSGLHSNPFAVLGVHQTPGGFVARCFIPGAEEVTVMTLDGNVAGELTRTDDDGFFEGVIDITKRQPVRYRALRDDAEWAVTDPYSFGPVLGPMDDYLVREGSIFASSTKWAHIPSSSKVSKVFILPSGHPMRAAFPSSAISTIGMAAAM